jgi:replicative DNA helicase
MSLDDRIPPHNAEAERALLGSILLDNQALNIALQFVAKEDFYQESHRITFEKMVDLSERNVVIDHVTLCEALGRAGMLGKAGGAAYLSALTDGVPIGTTAGVDQYCQIVKEASTLRRIIVASQHAIAKCFEGVESPEAIIEMASSQIFEIAERRTQSGFESTAQIARATFSDLAAAFERGRQHTGIDSGLEDLDSITCGFQSQELIVLAAPTSGGKTALALCFLAHAGISAGKKVGFFSLEMSKMAIMTRLVCMEGRIDSHKLRTGFCSRDDHMRASGALSRISQAPIYIDDSAGQTIQQIRAKARRLKSEHGLDILAVDYLQLVAPGKKCENRTQEVSYVSRSLKAIAKELGVPLLALSQLSRAPDKRKTTRPILSDLRESGTIEQDADVVIFIWHDPREKDDHEDLVSVGRNSTLIVAKQRNGPTGDVPVVFLKPYAKFENRVVTPDGFEDPGREERMPYRD